MVANHNKIKLELSSKKDNQQIPQIFQSWTTLLSNPWAKEETTVEIRKRFEQNNIETHHMKTGECSQNTVSREMYSFKYIYYKKDKNQ